MTSLSLTFDRTTNLARAAVWKGKDLIDLYLEHLDAPNLIGAIVQGKIERTMPSQKITFVDCGLSCSVTVAMGSAALKSGTVVALRLMSAPRQGKAWQGKICDHEIGEGEMGLLFPPPALWERALEDYGKEKFSTIRMTERQDYEICAVYLKANRPELVPALEPLSREAVHPDLDDIIATLSSPVVPLGGEGAPWLVIEETEALVAIDVNSTSGNAMTVNRAAITEAAHQIRLRNLSGTLMIDCLKMKDRTQNFQLVDYAKRLFASDPAGVDVFGLTKLGLLEIARRHRGPSLSAVLCGESE